MWEAPWFEREESVSFEAAFEGWAPPGLRLLAHREIPRPVSFSFTTNRVRAWVALCEVEVEADFAARLSSGEWGAFGPDELEALTLPAPSRKFLAASKKIL